MYLAIVVNLQLKALRVCHVARFLIRLNLLAVADRHLESKKQRREINVLGVCPQCHGEPRQTKPTCILRVTSRIVN